MSFLKNCRKPYEFRVYGNFFSTIFKDIKKETIYREYYKIYPETLTEYLNGYSVRVLTNSVYRKQTNLK
ncbi:MAG: hypothetical protein E7389_01955 [Ruminococcaceae bacterium]|nr:hypothetical protein [Oscillospiraceae bacterium]